MKIKNLKEDILYRLKTISSASVGILSTTISKLSNDSNSPPLNMFLSDMPNYLKYIFKLPNKLSYHLLGYDQDTLLAIAKLCGEAVERYGLVTSYFNFMPNQFILASYNEIEKMQVNYVNVFTNAQKKFLSKLINDTSSLRHFINKDHNNYDAL